MTFILGGYELKPGDRLSELREQDILWQIVHNKGDYLSVSIIDAYFLKDEKAYSGYAYCDFAPLPDGDYVLSAAHFIPSDSLDEMLRIPKREYQDRRFEKSCSIAKDLLGEPDEATEDKIVYYFDGWRIECEKIYHGRQIYQGGWLDAVFI